ncbi:MAG: transcriptional regulator GcvA [Pseudomonadota bacterium]|nr:transcriptional regulator GcvA [Pseudomonadota bacterium]
MSRRLPPLNALRAFEAAGRHLSFAKAADELAVTPPAVSHQVKQLEDWLGIALFRRMTRKVALTEEGRAALPLLSDAFDRLSDAVERVRAREETGALTVSVAPSFAARWLVPRVERFREAHPDIDLRISANIDIVDFRAGDVDVAIRFGRGGYARLKVDKLLSEAIAPLCSPRLLQGKHPLRSPGDLVHHTLLHDDSLVPGSAIPDWRMWLRINGFEKIDASRGPRFSYSDHALQAAVDGHGVLLGRLALAQTDLNAGRLIRPFGREIPTEFGYYLVRPDAGPDRPRVAAFRDWILAEARLEGSAAA